MKKILILTSSGGGGTLSASTAIADYLQKDYDVSTVHVFNELLKSIDFCSALTFGRYACEDVYNFFIPRKCFRMLTLLYYVGKWYIYAKQKSIRRILREYLIRTQPSLIISVVPILNHIILSLAQELDIPFLLIPTDLDLQMYIVNLKNPTYAKFQIGIPFHDPQLTNPLLKASIPTSNVSVIGAALRPDFFEPKNIPTLRQEFNMPENTTVIMILMGAQGSHDIEYYIQQLITISFPLHLIVCTGKNGKKTSNITLPSHITITSIEFTSRIADLMALSDIIITKSGSLSVCEAIYMDTPVILDATSAILPWEKFNHTFIKKHRFGTSVRKYADIVPLITELINKPEKLIAYKNNLKALKKENIATELEKCIRNMLTSK